MQAHDAVLVLGAQGMVGGAISRALAARSFSDVRTPPRAELDLRDAGAVDAYFARTRPAYVFVAAARVGGILANDSRPVDFLEDNLLIAVHVIRAAWRSQVRKLLFLGSSCIYPRLAPQPLREEALLSGPLEPTNEWYAVAKIAGIKLCQAYRRQRGCNFIAAMPTNLYGPHDNFAPASAHVLPALLQRFHAARVAGAPRVAVWGSGTPRREFLHVDDCAAACLLLMERYDAAEIINVGCGSDLSIRELAVLVARVVGYRGTIEFDASKPDGTPRKLLDVSRINALGWRPRIALEDGIRATYAWYCAQQA